MASLTHLLNSVLSRLDLQLVRRSTLAGHQTLLNASRRVLERLHLEEQQILEPSAAAVELPVDAELYLRHDNPRLTELRERYRAFRHPVMQSSQWSDDYVDREVNLTRFRGDYGYVFQFRDLNTELHYLLAYYYVKTRDRLDLLSKLDEDPLFGVHTVELGEGRRLSRDLLDSVLEIYFLERVLAISELPEVGVLDIGAGYGRLAHRLVRAMPNVTVYCTDAIPESTFLCEYYLRFRKAGDRAIVVPTDELERTLESTTIDVAVNIHSFSEIPYEAVCAWLDLVQRHRVRHLMIVPNPLRGEGLQLTSREEDGSRRDFQPAIRQRGYELVAQYPKFYDPMVQRHGVTPTFHHMFRLRPDFQQ